MKKSAKKIQLTESQIYQIKNKEMRRLMESSIPNIYMWRKVIDYLNDHFTLTDGKNAVTITDVDQDGNTIVVKGAKEKVGDQIMPDVLPLSNIVDKLDRNPIFTKIVRDEKSRRAFLSNVIRDWMEGRVFPKNIF